MSYRVKLHEKGALLFPHLAKTLESFFFWLTTNITTNLTKVLYRTMGGGWGSISISGNKEYFEILKDLWALNNVLQP